MKNPAAVLGYVILIVLLSAGAAASLSGSNTVYTDDIVNGQVFGGDIANNAITGGKIYNNTITGADVNEGSLVGVDRCPSPLTVKLGRICAGSDGATREWEAAADHCASHGLRLPTLAEAFTLATGHDVPGVTTGQFWTDNFFINGSANLASVVDESGNDGFTPIFGDPEMTVCVMLPTS